MEDWNWETIFTDIISLYSTTVTYLASKAIEFGEKRKNGYYAVQGHSRSSTSVPIERDFLLVIKVTDNLSRTVAEFSQLIGQILDTLRF